MNSARITVETDDGGEITITRDACMTNPPDPAAQTVINWQPIAEASQRLANAWADPDTEATTLGGQLARLLEAVPVSVLRNHVDATVWAWLLCCTVCGDEHQFRQVSGARDAWTWRHPDGHQYRTRAGNSLGAIVALRAEWQREAR